MDIENIAAPKRIYVWIIGILEQRTSAEGLNIYTQWLYTLKNAQIAKKTTPQQ